MTFPQPAQHPRTCQVCDGTGWQPGPPIHERQEGKTLTYTTVTPCTHHWSNDNPDDRP